MTTFEALSIIAQFALAIVATLTLIMSVVIYTNKKK